MTPPRGSEPGSGVPGDGVPSVVADALATVVAAQGRVRAGDVGEDAGPVLAEALRAVGVLSRWVDGALVELVAPFERSGAMLDDGHGSSATWLVVEQGMTRRRAGEVRATALAAAGMPEVAGAVRAGRLPLGHVTALVRARRAPVEPEFDAGEAALVAAACEMTQSELERHLQVWRYDALERLAVNDPDRWTPAPAGNRLRLRTTFEGRGVLDADLTAEVRAALEGLLAVEYRKLLDTGALECDPRTKPEVLGDLFAEFIAGASGTADPARPLVLVSADLDTVISRLADRPGLAQTLAELGLDLDPTTLRHRPVGEAERTVRRCQLGDGTPLSDDELAELLLGADLAALITTTTGLPLWLGRTKRLASDAQRAAVIATSDGCCYWPGCERTAGDCEVDHLHGWNDGGRTDIPNLGLLCRFHNRLKFRGHYTARRCRDGTITVTHPDGTPLRRTFNATRHDHPPPDP